MTFWYPKSGFKTKKQVLNQAKYRFNRDAARSDLGLKAIQFTRDKEGQANNNDPTLENPIL